MAARMFLVMLFHQKLYNGFCQIVVWLHQKPGGTVVNVGGRTTGRGDFDHPKNGGSAFAGYTNPSCSKLPRAQIVVLSQQQATESQKVHRFISPRLNLGIWFNSIETPLINGFGRIIISGGCRSCSWLTNEAEKGPKSIHTRLVVGWLVELLLRVATRRKD